ncbi:hypothetical protein B4U80_02916 [Leptotrombidium deliense]|uniref:Uncharacterized protein n=1 Tax=Leptotrombidium deliense TaxID=299467 RepID=A0A443RX43_9ACAR|nr:hypothetical protein B4U80_02916 [Leptotrombidium deliense]
MKNRFWLQNEAAFAEEVFATENRNIVVFPRLVDAIFGERIVAVNVPVYFKIVENTYLRLPEYVFFSKLGAFFFDVLITFPF